MLSVSVIIPILDSPLVTHAIARLKRQTYQLAEIIVVGRDTLDQIDRRDASVIFIDTIRSMSSAEARNWGACLAKGDILCFLDPDGLAEPDWLERLMACHARGEVVVGGGVVAPRSGYWTLCDNLLGFIDFLDSTPAGARAYLPTLNFSIRRSLFWDFGGFDETFVLHAGQDTDLSFRLRRNGYRLWFEPRARVVHCSSRDSIADVRAHLYLYGASYRYLERGNRDVIDGRSLRVSLCRWAPRLALFLSPLLAALDSLLYFANRPSLRQHWYALPGIAVARQAWYMGLIFGPEQVTTTNSKGLENT
jgi:GT2 family glycosyltransferase